MFNALLEVYNSGVVDNVVNSGSATQTPSNVTTYSIEFPPLAWFIFGVAFGIVITLAIVSLIKEAKSNDKSEKENNASYKEE